MDLRGRSGASRDRRRTLRTYSVLLGHAFVVLSVSILSQFHVLGWAPTFAIFLVSALWAGRYLSASRVKDP